MRFSWESFDGLLSRAKEKIEKIFPVAGERYTLQASNLRWENTGEDIYSDPALHKDYKIKGKTLAARLVGTFKIYDNATKKLVDAESAYPILSIPHLTSKRSFLVNGKEIQIVNQIRLKPGTYTRYTADNNVETFVNAPGGGYRVMLDRVKSIFRLRIGQSTYVHLLPILKGLGIDEDAIKKAWGDDVFAANKTKDNPEDMAKLYAKMRPYFSAPAEKEELNTAVKDFFASKRLDPSITRLTLGTAYKNITPETLLDSSARALKLSQGSIEEDDTENLAYKSIHSTDDFVLEKLDQQIEASTRRIAYMVDRRPKVIEAIPPRMFTEPVMRFFSTSEFSRYSDQNNPLDMLGVDSLVTTMGEGGLKSMHSVTDDLRALHPSHVGVLDPIHTSEAQKIGITNHLTLGARKMGTDLGLTVIDAKTGKRVEKRVVDLEDKVVAFNDQYDFSKGKPRALVHDLKVRAQGKFVTTSAAKVDYIFDAPAKMFGIVANAIPFLHNDSPNRALMATRHMEQAVPLKNPDVPSVQARFGAGGYESVLGKLLAPNSPVDGKVTKVKAAVVTILGDDKKTYTVQLHQYYPLNSNAFLHEVPIVKVGDLVKKNQTIADSDFTRKGDLAIGRTLRTAFLPYKGQNFEDGFVVSEGAADKLTSVHKHEMRLDLDATITTGLAKLLAYYPATAEGVDRSKFDAAGLLKKGVILHNGDLVIPGVRKITVHEEFDYTKLHKSLTNQWQDVSVRWDGDAPAEVIDVVKTRGFISVYVRTEEKLEIGDKISIRHGGKGIICNILPDKEMYRDEKGNVIDVLFNPASVLGRINPGTLFEAAAGKVAEKTGKPFLVDNFTNRDSIGTVQKALKDNGLSDLEGITDPTTNKVIPDVTVGNLHFVKLRHQVSKKLSARGITSYAHDESPAHSKANENPMAIGTMELYSLLAGGGTAFLRDATTLKSSKNDEYWRALQLGLPLPPLKTPFIVDKFVAYMRGAGINLKQEGTQLKALPLTDKDIMAQSNGEITSPGVVKANDLSPEDGGLFDKALTGGFAGNYWNHIVLADPIPNPLMDQAITSILGTPSKPFRKAEFEGLIEGNLFVTRDGKITTEAAGNKTGGEALKFLLSKIDVDKDTMSLRQQVRTLRGAPRDNAVKKLRYLRALKSMNMSPVEAYINTKIPIIPAKMRPIYPNPDGTLNVADPVHGYREVLLVNNQIKDLKKLGVDDKNLGKLRGDLYKAVCGLVGIQEPLTRSENFKGFIQTIKGPQNKYGLFQGRVLKRRQDLTGRSTIIPDPKLGLDEIKLPEDMAFVIYQPFIVNQLRAIGYPPLKARELIEAKDPAARAALEAVMRERPVLFNRAPSLHKFSIMSFKPLLTKGKAIEMNPLVVTGYSADFDGDAMQVHVPVSEAAREEAMTKLLPSKNLFSPRDNSVLNAPSKEMLLGVYLMTTPKGDPKPAASLKEVMDLYEHRTIAANTAITVKGRVICPGQIIFNEVLPQEFRKDFESVTKSKLMVIIAEIANKKPAIAGDIISKIKDLGNRYVTEIGYSFGLKDLHFPVAERDKIMADAAVDAKKRGFAVAYGDASKKMQTAVKTKVDNRIVIGGPISGAFGKSDEITQTIASPVAVKDHTGKVIEIPIMRSYAEGMDSGSYWTMIPGSRKGLMDRALSTGDTGTFSKHLLAATVDTMISEMDCGTTEGLTMPVTEPEALDRVIASGPYKGKILDTKLSRMLKAKGKDTIVVRSPLRCKSHRGMCAKCFGLLENGQFPQIGYHIGALAGQTISEPAMQLTMRSFHTGGSIGSSNVGYPRIKQIMEMPANVRGKAILSMQPGVVKSIAPSAAGGWNVDVDGMNHFVPMEQGLGVKKGQKVDAGQLLSTGGAVTPQDVLAATNDIRKVQDQMIGEIGGIYRQSNINIKRRIFEAAIQPLTNRAEVSDPGDADVEFGINVGDVKSINILDDFNNQLKKKGKRPILFVPTLLSIKTAPSYAEDFIGQMIAERPHQTLKNAPSLAATSNIGPSGHPIATYAFGRFFGTKAEDHKKKTASEVGQEIQDLSTLLVEPEEEKPPEFTEDVNKVLEELRDAL